MKFFTKFVICHADGSPYLVRYILFKSNLFSIYLHKFESSDEDRDMHDHPWPFASLILWRGYFEHTPDETWSLSARIRKKLRKWPGMLLFRKATHQHIVELHRDANGKELPAWTLVFTGKRIREWGFWTRAGFKHWREYLDEKFGKDNYDTVD